MWYQVYLECTIPLMINHQNKKKYFLMQFHAFRKNTQELFPKCVIYDFAASYGDLKH